MKYSEPFLIQLDESDDLMMVVICNECGSLVADTHLHNLIIHEIAELGLKKETLYSTFKEE